MIERGPNAHGNLAKEGVMDLTLVWLGLGLMIGGFLVNLYGVWLQRRGLTPDEAGGWMDWVGKAINGMFTALPKALGNHPIGVKIQAFGSALTYLGVIFLLAFLKGQFDDTGDGAGESPSPSASSAPSSS
jgi:hypothetical protein